MIKYGKSLPITVEQAVEWLISELPLEEKARIVNTGEWNLMGLYFSLIVDIENKFCLPWENKALVESCRVVSGDEYFFAEEGSYIIITELWKQLQRFYKSNVVE